MEPRSLTLADLKPLVDADEMKKGAEAYDDGEGLSDLSRCETRLFALAKGSGQSSYRVDVNVGPAGGTVGLKSRCTCFAAKTRPFCKHAVAVLLAWAREPSRFVVADAPPATAIPGTARPKKAALDIKKTAVDGDALMLAGTEKLEAMITELAAAGVAVGRDDDGARAKNIRALAETLREHRLRRLSARTLELAQLVEKAAGGAVVGDVDAVAFADALADLLLCSRRIAKHLRAVSSGEGEPLAPRYVEELVGKSWTKKDRTEIAGLDLLEVAYLSRRTSDDFRVVESRFVDVKTGVHYNEKQILPGFLATRTPPKKSYAGQVLNGAGGSIYPSFAPLRVDIEAAGAAAVVDDAVLQRLLATCLPGLDDAIALLQEQKRDPFAPDLVPVAVRVECLLAAGSRVQLVDERDQALFLPPDRSLLDRLALGLRGVKLRAAIGDMGIDGALPTLWPIALVVERPNGLALVSVGAGQPEAGHGKKREHKPLSWSETARAAFGGAHVPRAALVLGEVREELARLLVTGLQALSPHAIEPAAVRLDELGLTKPAELLRTSSKKPEARDRLDDIVKLHHVTGVALVRLAASSSVERESLVAVPTFESVRVRRRKERLNPREVATLTAQGQLNRYEAAVEYAAFYDGVSPEELAAHIYPTWADGSAQPFVARAFADKGARAVDAAERVLELPVPGESKPAWMRSPARVARITALRVLEAVLLKGPNDRARALLVRVAGVVDDGGLRAHARRILRSLGIPVPVPTMAMRGGSIDELRETLVSGRSEGDRQKAAESLAERGDLDAIPALRAVLDETGGPYLFDSCVLALARLGDVESFDVFVDLLSQRGESASNGRVGVQALGALGDIRGVHDLVEAWAAGFEPLLVAAAIQGIGTAALETFVAYLDANAEMGRRVSAKAVLRALPNDEVGALMQARLTAMQGDPRFIERAAVLLPLVEYCQPIAKACAARIRELQPNLSTSTEDRALFLASRCALLLDEPAPKPTPKRPAKR
ncbi:MAG: SWIM zinc finger family protein [Deltaproteobacteria bacterium]|nr:SWIM zinc finger family protein [Deltaproteobacteria bacterium]